jgi:hypothetical protein
MVDQGTRRGILIAKEGGFQSIRRASLVAQTHQCHHFVSHDYLQQFSCGLCQTFQWKGTRFRLARNEQKSPIFRDVSPSKFHLIRHAQTNHGNAHCPQLCMSSILRSTHYHPSLASHYFRILWAAYARGSTQRDEILKEMYVLIIQDRVLTVHLFKYSSLFPLALPASHIPSHASRPAR